MQAIFFFIFTLRACSSRKPWYLILNAFTIRFAAKTSGMTLDLILTMIIHHVAPPKNVSEAFDTLTKGGGRRQEERWGEWDGEGGGGLVTNTGLK